MAVTKQQLQAEVEALRAECDRLRTENAALRSRSATIPTKQRPKFIVPPEEEARRAEIRARMEAARAEAMRTGKTVRVR